MGRATIEVWYINLLRRRDRNISIYQNLTKQGFPVDLIKRFPATDAKSFDCPHSFIDFAVHAAQLDFFAQCAEYEWQHKYLGYMVSYFRALRDISNQSNVVMLMEDDYQITIDYDTLVRYVSELPHNFDMAMLGYNQRSDDFISLPPYKNSEIWNVGSPANGNSANVFTPVGASRLFHICAENIDKTPEYTIQVALPDDFMVYSVKKEMIPIITSPEAGDSDV